MIQLIMMLWLLRDVEPGITKEKETHEFAVRLKDFLEIPATLYYPAPHPFAGGWPKQAVITSNEAGTREGVVNSLKTTDHQVAVDFGEGDEKETKIFKPSEVRFPESAAQQVLEHEKTLASPGDDQQPE